MAIDNSVTTALAQHPRLRKYYIALACDLTDKTAGRGKKGWEHWNEHRKRWEAEAKRAVGHDVVFEPWTASTLADMLEQPPMAGLRGRFFGGLSLTPDWFVDRVAQAVVDLDERYHAEDHVPVELERLFDIVLRSDRGRDVLRARLDRVRQRAGRCLTAPPALSDLNTDVEEAKAAVDDVLAFEGHLDDASWTSWQSSKWSQLAKIAQARVSVVATKIRDRLRGTDFAKSLDSAARQRRQQREEFDRLASDLEALDQLWAGPVFQAEAGRVFLLTGRGGTGKSHLLARQAQVAAQEGRPVVLLLGQHFTAGAVWPQILGRLGADGSAERFLQALDSAAESANRRALFLVDALNEGAGAPLWRHQVASLLATLARYENIVCVLSCRREYLKHVIPGSVQDGLVQLEVVGFVTPEEQRAAALVYMDKKGIARPSFPWLTEEFTNPLFLRSVCVALHREGKHEFPVGLVGIKKILALYVDSVARHLVAEYEGTNDLVAPTYATLLAISRAMATARRDYISRSAADAIAREQFASFSKGSQRTWLELLRGGGLFRFDPDPELDEESSVPLPESIDVVRFSFQRFQDQLTAEALLKDVKDVTRAVGKGGALHFMTDPSTWGLLGAGLIDALANQVPERYRVELVDVLPGGLKRWRYDDTMRSAFSESVRLRAPEAFSARTTELFETWLATGGRSVSLLLALATVPDHPWNAEGMHARLSSTSLPQRDVRWTLALNEIRRADDRHGFYRLCNWCASPDVKTAIDRTRELAALALAWCFTSSNRPVRDAATKALSHLLLAQPDLMLYLIPKLKNVDDDYVHERLWAAAFGACTIDPSAVRLQLNARAAWHAVFAESPRKNLLLRDYARAIVDFAAHVRVDLGGIDVARCRPPYKDAAIDLTKVRKLTDSFEKRLSHGARSIVFSCLRLGDFGSYDIRPAVRDITTVSLDAPAVVSKEAAFRSFRKIALDERVDRVASFHRLEEHLRQMHMPQAMERDDGFAFVSKTPSARDIERAKMLEKAFLAFLNAEEVLSYHRDAAPWLADSHSDPTERVDAQRCATWVALRAIELGGLAVDALGPESGSGRDRPIVERLGKKYQWLALGELLCSLTSTLGLEVGWHEDRTLKPYDFPTDLGFTRDIDPTILSGDAAPMAGPSDSWMFGVTIALDEVDESELSSWPLRVDPGEGFDKTVVRVDADGSRWLTLSEHAHRTETYPGKTIDHGMRQQEFRRVFSVFVESDRLKDFLALLTREKGINVTDWEVQQLTDGPYFGEVFWRATAPQEQWQDRGPSLPPTIRLAYPVCEYVWESHLDLSLSEGARAELPASWLAKRLGILVPTGAADTPVGADGRQLFIRKALHEDSVVLLREDAVERLGREAGLSCVWLLVAERNAWPGGTNAAGTWWRAEGVAWMDGSYIVSKTWRHDGSALAIAAHASAVSRKRPSKPRR